MQIPLVDLQAQFQPIKMKIMAEIEDVLENMHLFLGPQNEAFENEFAQYCGCQYGIGLSSGTDALVLALQACDIGHGDEVITVANTFIATVEAIALTGAKPVFIDIDQETYTMDWTQLSKALTPRTRAIIPVHLYGHPVEMQPIVEFARKHGLRVIEDASQAHGATYLGERVGSLGDIGCFSFYFSKNLGAYGEAGACVTNDAKLADSIRMFRDHGSRIRYRHEVLGGNSRMDEIQAAILRVKLPYLDEWNAARHAHASYYTEQLQGIVEAVPIVRVWATHVYYTYVVRVHERDIFRKALEQEGIATGIHYPTPIHLQHACAQYGYERGMLPVTEAVTDRIVSLPMYPELTTEQRQRVVHAVKRNIMSGMTSW
jgi:dTDP-4-amino-4,6-dideoxygalactose transaminase